MVRNKKVLTIVAGTLALTAIAAPQIKEILKVVGVGAAVKQFGPDINKAINKLSGQKDTAVKSTKVVPIISIGVGGKNSYIGAAQVMGTAATLKKVEAVASPEADLFGKEIRVRALIPVATKEVQNGIKAVDGVGVSGIVDLKL